MLPFERVPCMCFSFGCGRAVLGPLVKYPVPELKENYTKKTASTSFPGPLGFCDHVNTQRFDDIRK